MWVQPHSTQVAPGVGQGAQAENGPFPASPRDESVSRLKSCGPRVTTVNEHAPQSGPRPSAAQGPARWARADAPTSQGGLRLRASPAAPCGAGLRLACHEVLSVTPLSGTLMDLGTPSTAGSH